MQEKKLKCESSNGVDVPEPIGWTRISAKDMFTVTITATVIVTVTVMVTVTVTIMATVTVI